MIRKKFLKYFIAAMVLTAAGAMMISKLSFVALADQNEPQFRYVPNEAYGFGEKLEYRVGYKFITAGRGYFEIAPDPIYKNGRKCYDVRFLVKSLESLDWLYRVRDQYRTILDISGIFPWEFQQQVREGNYKRDFKASFDQENHIALANDKKYPTSPYVNDIVSAFYYVRTLNLQSMKKDSVFYMKNFWDDSTYTLGIVIKGRETIEVEAGKFKCIVIEPLVVQGGLFQSEGNIFIWVSDDDRKIPVKVATRIPIGFVEAELTHYSGLRGPLSSKLEN